MQCSALTALLLTSYEVTRLLPYVPFYLFVCVLLNRILITYFHNYLYTYLLYAIQLAGLSSVHLPADSLYDSSVKGLQPDSEQYRS